METAESSVMDVMLPLGEGKKTGRMRMFFN